MDGCLEFLSEVQILSILGANPKCRQTEIGNKDIDKTAFVKYHERFGLGNISATLRRAMDVIPAIVKQKHAFVCMHNSNGFSKTLEIYSKHIEHQLCSLIKTWVKFRMKKCHSYSKSVELLGLETAP